MVTRIKWQLCSVLGMAALDSTLIIIVIWVIVIIVTMCTYNRKVQLLCVALTLAVLLQ